MLTGWAGDGNVANLCIWVGAKKTTAQSLLKTPVSVEKSPVAIKSTVDARDVLRCS